ncbi:hypothetical protein IWX49DRAFT_635636 [Phyllosticta citricarpa]|uniref:Uncharacterized protein n=2 Tax=Phyllosticta TaxID=121621 RepID=A0ABR1MG38_9PEZI
MPMNWNSDADARLLVGIVNFTDFKLNKETLAKLNEWMGPDCVGQSISQRLIKLKKKFYEDHPELVGATFSGAGSSEADLKAPKTPKSASKGNKRKKADNDDGSADAEADETVTPTPKKRGRKKAATPGASDETGEDGAVPPTPTPKKRGRPKKSEAAAAKLSKETEQAGIKEEPGSDNEGRADSVMGTAGDQLLAAAEGLNDNDQQNNDPNGRQADSDDGEA